MKNNTQKIKNLLNQALVDMPNDFCLFDAKQHIRIAINKINEVEEKRNKRKILKEKRTEKLKLKANSINIIDKMIELESEKLKEEKQ